MTQACFLCHREIGNTTLIFKNSDLRVNDLIIPPQMTDDDVLCVHCFDLSVKNPAINVSKGRINTLVNILEQEMIHDAVDLDNLLENLEQEMNGWGLSEPVKTFYLVQVMDIIEIALTDQSSKLSSFNEIRKLLLDNFDASYESKN